MKKDYKVGEELLLNNGKKCIFVRGKQKKFIGTIEGVSYDIPFSMITNDEIEAELERNRPKEIDPSTLIKGEMFFIDKGEKALLFVFQTVRNSGKVEALNPLTQQVTTISSSFRFYKV